MKELRKQSFNVELFQDILALEEGTELLTKPFTPADLAGKVREMLDAMKS